MMRPTLQAEPEMGWYQVGDAWALSLRAFDAELGQEVLPTSATLTIEHAGGGDILVGTMTVDGSAMTYELAAGVVTVPERGMRAVVTLEADGQTWTVLHLFDAVWFSPRMTLTPSLCAQQCARWVSLQTPADPKSMALIRQAWTDVLLFVTAIAGYPDLAIAPLDLQSGHLYRVLELAWGRAQLEDQGAAELQRRAWHDEWEGWKKRARPTIDRNETGTVELGEQGTSVNVVGFGRSVR